MMYKQIRDSIGVLKDRVIVCLETAADYTSLSNGVGRETVFRVYSETPIQSSNLSIIVCPGCFVSKQHQEFDGLICTTHEQTILDLLENEDNVSLQTLIESLSNYYYEHGESFGNLECAMNDIQRRSFMRWRQDAIDYYSED